MSKIIFISIIYFLSLNAYGQSRYAPFTPEQVNAKDFVLIKSQEWSACRQNNSLQIQEASAFEALNAFLDNRPAIKNLKQLDDLRLTTGQARQTPWSGDYWPYAHGILGARYLSSEFAQVFDWFNRYQYIQDHPAPLMIANDGQAAVNSLSPSEKYDLLVNDQSYALTDLMWQQGKYYYDQNGEVESWMGICHGWAAAAIMEPRPEKTVQVASFDNKWQVRFLPSEIKGLVSYSWATNNFPTIFLGQRCNKKDPKRDENGRLIDPECVDLNPATWHLAIVNRLGKLGRSFVMDATYDYQVWNQPVVEYSYSYFNPQTRESASLQESIVTTAQFTNDKYKKYRGDKTKFIVGITMTVRYTVETSANEADIDSSQEDVIVDTQYDYDLELNQNGDIIGGEWYQDTHPDFIWTPQANKSPQGPYDHLLHVNEWPKQSTGPVPANWSAIAQKSSQNGYILHTLTKALLLKAQP